MSEYLETVIKAAGGHAAPVENLEEEEVEYSDFFEFDEDDTAFLEDVGEEYEDFGEEEEEDEDRPPAPPGYHYMPDGTLMRDDAHSIQATAGSKPAPKKDQIKGSSKNKKGSAATGKGVTFSAKVIKALENKVEKHNEKHGDTASKKTSLRTLKAVYRRGAGAFSTSHRPDQNRNSWAMARVNAFLHLLRTGSPKNKKYVTDNDLLPAAHRRSSKKSAAITAAADPCWDGYKQVGMKKGKDGDMVPNCVPSSAAIDYVVSQHNSEFGDSREVSIESAYKVARAAADKYNYLSCEKLSDAVLWELDVFMEYATTGMSEFADQMAVYSELLPDGHPDTESSLLASAKWLSGASELEESSRNAVFYSLTQPKDSVEALHATTRLNVLISSGVLSAATVKQIMSFSEATTQVD